MIAVTTIGASVAGLVGYNETKCEGNIANHVPNDEILVSSRKAVTDHLVTHELNYSGKSKRTAWQTVLSFSPDDKPIDPDRLKLIAQSYMDKMGFGKQPFQVYEHFDKPGHQHIHIVSTRVKENGRLVTDSHNYRANARVCREVEKEFGLVVPVRKKPGVFSGIAAILNEAVKVAVQDKLVATFPKLKAALKILGVDFVILPKVKGKKLDAPEMSFFIRKSYNVQLHGNIPQSKGISGSKVGFTYAKLNEILKENGIVAPEIDVKQNVKQYLTKSLTDKYPIIVTPSHQILKDAIEKALKTVSSAGELDKVLLLSGIKVKFFEKNSPYEPGVKIIHAANFTLPGEKSIKGSDVGYKWEDIYKAMKLNIRLPEKKAPAAAQKNPSSLLYKEAPLVPGGTSPYVAPILPTAALVVPVPVALVSPPAAIIDNSEQLILVIAALRQYVPYSEEPKEFITQAIAQVMKDDPSQDMARFVFQPDDLTALVKISAEEIENYNEQLQEDEDLKKDKTRGIRR